MLIAAVAVSLGDVPSLPPLIAVPSSVAHGAEYTTPPNALNVCAVLTHAERISASVFTRACGRIPMPMGEALVALCPCAPEIS